MDGYWFGTTVTATHSNCIGSRTDYGTQRGRFWCNTIDAYRNLAVHLIII